MSTENQNFQNQMKEEEDIKKNIRDIKFKIMIMSNKGGVGKSTISSNIATMLHKKGYKVGVLDADVHGPSMAKIFDIEDKRLQVTEQNRIVPIVLDNGMKVVSIASILETTDTPLIWRGPMRTNLLRQFVKDVEWGELDYLIIDSPPGTGDEPLTIAQTITNMNGIVIVTTPQDIAVLDSTKAVNFARAVNVPIIGIVENMSGLKCPHCGENIDLFGKGGGKKIAEKMSVSFLGEIPLEPEIVSAMDEGKAYLEKKGDDCITKEFDAIVCKITDQMEYNSESISKKDDESTSNDMKEGSKMLISIPTDGNNGLNDVVCSHFGQANYFTLYDSEKKDIKVIPNTSEHKGGTGLPPELLRDNGVNVMLCGGIGGRAIDLFNQFGIKVFVGAGGNVKDTIERFEKGELREATMDDGCQSHGHGGHGCN